MTQSKPLFCLELSANLKVLAKRLVYSTSYGIVRTEVRVFRLFVINPMRYGAKDNTMSTLVHRECVARVGLAEVFVEPVLGSAINLSQDPMRPLEVHLRVVDYRGGRFTEGELNGWMSLDHTTIGELVELCKRRKDTLCAQYLPGTMNPEVTPMQCWIGPDGIADVEILLSAICKS